MGKNDASKEERRSVVG